MIQDYPVYVCIYLIIRFVHQLNNLFRIPITFFIYHRVQDALREDIVLNALSAEIIINYLLVILILPQFLILNVVII